MSYPISLEVNENSSSDLGDQDEQEAGKVLGIKKKSQYKTFKIKTFKTLRILQEINNKQLQSNISNDKVNEATHSYKPTKTQTLQLPSASQSFI